MVPLEVEYGNWEKGHGPGVKVGGSLGMVAGSPSGAQNQQWEERKQEFEEQGHVDSLQRGWWS